MNIVEESFRLYWGTNGYWLLYVVAFVFLLLSRKEREYRTFFCWYAFIIIVVIMNPLFAGILSKVIDSSENYVRTYYLLPIVTMMAYAGTKVVALAKKKTEQIFLVAALCVTVIFAGESYYERDAYQRSENIYKIPQEEVTLADAILDDIEPDESANVLAVLWDPNWYYIRQYTNRIVGVGYAMPELWYKDYNYTCHGEVNNYIEYMYHEGYDYQYMIVENNPDMLQDYRNGGHIILTETDHYAVVKTVRSAEKDD